MRRSFSTLLNSGLIKSSGFQKIHQASLHTTVLQRLSQGDATLDSTEPLILVQHYNAITLIGLNRPLKRNALNLDLLEALRKELKAFEANDLSTVAVLYGTGGNFCAGLDLEEISLNKHSIPLVDEFCCKPVVASINGYAVGEGFDLAMACDVRVMEDQAILGSFGRRFGVPMSEPALRRLSASAGFAITMELILTGRPIKAEEALQRGLVQQTSRCGAGKGNALTLAQSLTKYPQDALRADRAALLQTLQLPDDFQTSLNSERTYTVPRAIEVCIYFLLYILYCGYIHTDVLVELPFL